MKEEFLMVTPAQYKAGWWEWFSEHGTSVILHRDYTLICRAANGVDYVVRAPTLQVKAEAFVK